jgi:hypothetical protein
MLLRMGSRRRGGFKETAEGATEVDDHLWMTWRLSRRYRETRTTIKLKILVLFPGYTRSQVSSISSLKLLAGIRVLCSLNDEFCTLEIFLV